MSERSDSGRQKALKHDLGNHRACVKAALEEANPDPEKSPEPLIAVLIALSHNWSETNLWLGELVHELRERRQK